MSELDPDHRVVQSDSPLNDNTVELSGDEVRFHDLLCEVVPEDDVPALMLANLAIAANDLIEARDLVSRPERGMADINGPGYGLSYCHRVREAIEEHRDREPMQLVAVGCSGSKHDVDEPTPAADLYKGGYWTNKQEYAEALGEDWRIISAQHAVLEPDERIDHYERVPEHLEGVPVDSEQRLPNGDHVETLLDQWALRVHLGLAQWFDEVAGGVDPRDIELEVLLGKKYEKPLRKRGVFDRLRVRGDIEVSFPFREVDDLTGIGKQRGWMSEQVQAATAIATDGGVDRE